MYNNTKKQGPQGPQKLSSLKSLKVQNPPPQPGIFTPETIRNGLSNSRWQTRIEVTNRSTNKRDMDETDERYVVCEGHTSWREAELLKIILTLFWRTQNISRFF